MPISSLNWAPIRKLNESTFPTFNKEDGRPHSFIYFSYAPSLKFFFSHVSLVQKSSPREDLSTGKTTQSAPSLWRRWSPCWPTAHSAPEHWKWVWDEYYEVITSEFQILSTHPLFLILWIRSPKLKSSSRYLPFSFRGISVDIAFNNMVRTWPVPSRVSHITPFFSSRPKVINSPNQSHRDHIWGMFEL